MRRRWVLALGLVSIPVLAGLAAAGVSQALDPSPQREGAPPPSRGDVDSTPAPRPDPRLDPTPTIPPVDRTSPSPERSRTAPSRPAASGEVPVLLVPGWLDTARDLAALRIRLLGAGWPVDYVETITFQEPTGSNRDHAKELGVAIDELVERTGAAEVDLIVHSMGGLATRWYLRTHEDAPVRRVVFIATPHRGTLSAHLAWGGGREEMMVDSPFLDTLNAEAPAPEGVEALTIRTAVDTHVVPGESATLPGVVDHELCCPTHAGLLRDDEVFEIVLDFLEGG